MPPKMNTTYISLSGVAEKDEIYLEFAPKKYFFLFYTERKYRKHNLTYSLVVSRLICLFQYAYWEMVYN